MNASSPSRAEWSPDDAEAYLRAAAHDFSGDLELVVRAAQYVSHPDRWGRSRVFHDTVDIAVASLRKAGRIPMDETDIRNAGITLEEAIERIEDEQDRDAILNREGNTVPFDKRRFAELPNIDPRLVWMLHFLGDEFGPLGVALAAAELTDKDLLVRQLTTPRQEWPAAEIPG